VGALSLVGVMNPKPFRLENHFTVPLIFSAALTTAISSMLTTSNNNQIKNDPFCVLLLCGDVSGVVLRDVKGF
jgi:hypothetical protein